MTTTKATQRDRLMIDALRAMLGLDPLYKDEPDSSQRYISLMYVDSIGDGNMRTNKHGS